MSDNIQNLNYFSAVNSSPCSGQTVPQDMCALFFNERDCGGQAYSMPIRHNIRAGCNSIDII